MIRNSGVRRSMAKMNRRYGICSEFTPTATSGIGLGLKGSVIKCCYLHDIIPQLSEFSFVRQAFLHFLNRPARPRSGAHVQFAADPIQLGQRRRLDHLANQGFAPIALGLGPKARPVPNSGGPTRSRSAAAPSPGCDPRCPALIALGPTYPAVLELAAHHPLGPSVSPPAASPGQWPSSPPGFRAKGDNGWTSKNSHGPETHSSRSPAPKNQKTPPVSIRKADFPAP